MAAKTRSSKARKRATTTKKHRKAHEKGHRFEDQVAKWVKKKFYAERVEKRIKLRGFNRRQPYEVDVYAVKGIGWSKGDYGAWFECKDLKTTVKQYHIQKSLSDAKDVRLAVKKGIEPKKVTSLLFVSNGPYYVDALTWATNHKIPCFEKTPKGFVLRNKVKLWSFGGDLVRNLG